MMAPPAAAAPQAAPAPGGGASVGQGAPRHPLADTGRHLRGDDLAPSTHHTAAGGDVGNATAAAAGVAFLAMLRGPIAGAHTRLALLRTQQFTSNAVTASAIGVFEIGADTTYVLATAHGVSYLPHNGAVPSDTRLLTELVDDTFYGQWCGYVNPVTKLAAFAATDQAVGHLTYVLTTDGGVDLPGVEVVTQSLIDVQNLASSNLLAATSRSRRDIVLAADADLGVEVRDMAMRTHVLRGDQYLHVLGSASGALWINDVDRNAYLEEWLRVLTADALRAVEQGDRGTPGSRSLSTGARPLLSPSS
ncbi:hypothetical protein GS531_24085 [Rhodococcus hoagii]|nr:hypothetical protein [Prescottella equi]